MRVYFTTTKIHSMDHEGELWDEISNQRLDSAKSVMQGWKKCQQLQSHEICEHVPLEESWQSTGRNPGSVEWADINKGDEVKHEHRSRLAAKKYQDGQASRSARSSSTIRR